MPRMGYKSISVPGDSHEALVHYSNQKSKSMANVFREAMDLYALFSLGRLLPAGDLSVTEREFLENVARDGQKHPDGTPFSRGSLTN